MVPLTSSPSLVLPGPLSDGFFHQGKSSFWGLTSVFKLELKVKDGYDLALALSNFDISVLREEFGNFSRGTISFCLDSDKVLLEVLLGPCGDIFVHPVPVVGVVQDHDD